MAARRPRLMLVTPPYHSGVVEAAGVWPPLHYVYLAGHARAAGAEVRIYDAMSLFHSHQDIAREMAGLGTPDETVESIRKTVELAKWYAPDMAFFLALTPWPYADLTLDAGAGLEERVATRDYRRYNLVEPVLKPDRMTLEEMQRELHRATGHFFHDKFRNLDRLSPEKRRFMVRVLRLLIEQSYLGKEMHRMASGAEMPEAVRTMLAEIEAEDRRLGRGEPARRAV